MTSKDMRRTAELIRGCDDVGIKFFGGMAEIWWRERAAPDIFEGDSGKRGPADREPGPGLLAGVSSAVGRTIDALAAGDTNGAVGLLRELKASIRERQEAAETWSSKT